MRAIFLVLGVAMLVIAIAWRARDLRRRSGGMEEALRSSDPFTRTRALREMASVGLRPWASMLLTRTQEVGDGVEADELVWLIGACQWEPADEPEIVQLRLWAARRLERAPVVPDPPAVVSVPPPPIAVASIAVETLDLSDAEARDAPAVIDIVVPPAPAAASSEPGSLEPEVLAVLEPEPPAEAEPEPEPDVVAEIEEPVAEPEPELAPVELAEPEPEAAPLPVPAFALATVVPDRPPIVDEIESIVGARVLAVKFVPLTGAAA